VTVLRDSEVTPASTTVTDLVVIVPSRGRPAAAVQLAAAFTATAATSRLVLAVDDDDPTRFAYTDALSAYPATTVHYAPAPSTMVKTLNIAAVLYADEAHAIGFMGDDHRPRTRHWDAMYLAALDQLRTGIVYGDDLLQGARIPTQVAMTADIVRTLGHMAPAALTHLYVDNYWKALGEGAACIRYLPDVVVEHMHPIAGKAEWDEGHKRVNQSSMYQRDGDAYADYAGSHLVDDIAKVRALR
jgi:hypothetical protein